MPKTPYTDAERIINTYLDADQTYRMARSEMEYRRCAVVAMMAGERLLCTPEFIVTHDLGLLIVQRRPETESEAPHA